MTSTLFVELTGRFDFDAMVAAMTRLGTLLGGEQPWDSVSAVRFQPKHSKVTHTLEAPLARLAISAELDQIDPREGTFVRWEFALRAPRGAARWDGAEWGTRAAIRLDLEDLGEFDRCRAALVAGYGTDFAADTTDRPEHAAHNAGVLARHGQEERALQIAQLVLSRGPERNEGAARAKLEGLRLRLGGEGPDGVWLRRTLARDPGNIAAWRMLGGPEAERVLGLLTPFDVEALQAGAEPMRSRERDGHPVSRGGRPVSFEAPRALRDQLFTEAGASARDVRRHLREGGSEESEGWKAEHGACWFGDGVRVWVQVTTNKGGTLRRVDWLFDEEFDREAVFIQSTHLPRLKGLAVDNRQARVLLLPNAARWASAMEAAGLRLSSASGPALHR
jgi:hypothetical protein